MLAVLAAVALFVSTLLLLLALVVVRCYDICIGQRGKQGCDRVLEVADFDDTPGGARQPGGLGVAAPVIMPGFNKGAARMVPGRCGGRISYSAGSALRGLD